MTPLNEPRYAGSVLAVDDCPTMREIVRASLEGRGYRVRAVDSGRAALDAAAEFRYDAVVLDVEMPGLDGLAVGRALRDDPRARATVIAMHSSVAEAEVRAGFDGYDVYVPKSADVFSLGDQVDRLVRRRRPADPGPAATVAAASPAAPR
jgi:two-component system OmpR family response regulator